MHYKMVQAWVTISDATKFSAQTNSRLATEELPISCDNFDELKKFWVIWEKTSDRSSIMIAAVFVICVAQFSYVYATAATCPPETATLCEDGTKKMCEILFPGSTGFVNRIEWLCRQWE